MIDYKNNMKSVKIKTIIPYMSQAWCSSIAQVLFPRIRAICKPVLCVSIALGERIFGDIAEMTNVTWLHFNPLCTTGLLTPNMIG